MGFNSGFKGLTTPFIASSSAVHRGRTRCDPVGGTVQSLACGWLPDAVNIWKVSRSPGLNPLLFVIRNRRVNHSHTTFRSYTSRTALKLRFSGDRSLQCRSGGPCDATLQYVRHKEFSSLWLMCLLQSVCQIVTLRTACKSGSA